jgi:hypothetical protein
MDARAGEFQLTSTDEAGGELHGDFRGGEARAEYRGGEAPAQLLNRKMLLDLRDSLRAFLTLLERR